MTIHVLKVDNLNRVLIKYFIKFKVDQMQTEVAEGDGGAAQTGDGSLRAWPPNASPGTPKQAQSGIKDYLYQTGARNA